MSETPNALTFDLKAALQNRTYASQEFWVSLDEAAMFEYNRLSVDSDYDPKNEDKKKARDEFLATFIDAFLKVTVRSVPPHVVDAERDAIQAEHPTSYNPLTGAPQPNPVADKLFQRKMWAHHIVSIQNSKGEGALINSENIDELLRMAPGITLTRIKDAINELSDNTKTAYRTIVTDPDFLSRH